MERRNFLLGLGALALAAPSTRAARAAGAPAAAGSAAAEADRGGAGGIGLATLLAIVGRPGATAWIQAFSHVLELPLGKAPRVAFAELSVVELRIRAAAPAEAGGADLGGGALFRVDLRGAAQPLTAGTHLPLREYVDRASGRRAVVVPSRWTAAALLSESAWLPLDAPRGPARPRVAPRVARAGAEWCVFHEATAAGFDAGTSAAVVESTGWRVQPRALGGARVEAGYNHVALLPAAARPWLAADATGGAQWLANATGHKVFERRALSRAARELLP